jgi:hypothetical protein
MIHLLGQAAEWCLAAPATARRIGTVNALANGDCVDH